MTQLFASVPWILAVSAAVIIFTVLWRGATAAVGDNPLGRAMAAVYSLSLIHI